MLSEHLKTEFANLEPHDVLRAKPSVLLGVTANAATALEPLGITSVFDLAASRVFQEATELVRAASDSDSVIARYGAPPHDVLDGSGAGVRLDELQLRGLDALEAIDPPEAAALATALDVKTIRDLALWPPYLAAKEFLQQVLLPERAPGFDPEAPADLLPKSGDYPVERTYYKTLVLDEIEDDPANLKALETAGPIDVTPAARDDFGFTKPGVGALLTFAQSWFAQGVALGQLLHSVALAPGESTRIAMIDWSRRSRASTTEAITEAEDLDNATQHSRAISEVQRAVASESQSGFSKTHAQSSSSEAGGGLGLGLGPLTIGATGSGASSTTDAMSFSTSSGRRDLEASMNQNVMDSTHQHASSVRNRRASIVREVSQTEHEEVSTRVVTNYNHMHALSVQYYEVVQIYRVAVQLHEVDKCLYIPMKLVDFSKQEVVERFRFALADAAVDARGRRLLTTEYGVVEVIPNTPRISMSRIVAAARVPVAAAARLAGGGDVPADAPPEAVARPAATPSQVAVAAEKGWDLTQISRISSIVSRPIVRPSSDSLFLPDDVELVGISLRNAQVGEIKVERRDGTNVGLSNPSSIGGTLSDSTPLVELASISLSNPADHEVQATVVLLLSNLGRNFSLDVPVTLAKSAGLQKVITFGGTQASRELSEHLQANRLHYSQAVWRALDSAALALLLSPYKYGNKPVAQLIDPLPITVAGNYLVFRMHQPATTAEGAPSEWGEWLKEHGIDMGKVQQDIVPLPSSGVFAEAVLGRFNAAEKLDITRFWNWQDSPIPIQAPDIAAIQTGSRAEPEDLKPGQLSQPLVNIVSPTALPDPAGLGAILTAIANGNMFRDMSGLAATIGLARAGLEATSEAAGRAGAQAGANLVTAAQKEVEMAKTAVAAMQAMMGAPSGGGGSASSISKQGAMINHGKSLDERGVGAQGAGGEGQPGAGPNGAGPTAATGGSTTSPDVDSSGEPDTVGANELEATKAMLWPGIGQAGGQLLQQISGTGSAAGSGTATAPQITYVGPRSQAPSSWSSDVQQAGSAADRFALVEKVLAPFKIVDCTAACASDTEVNPAHLTAYDPAAPVVNYDDNLNAKSGRASSAGFTKLHNGKSYVVLGPKALRDTDYYWTRILLNHEFDHVRQNMASSPLTGNDSEVDAWASTFVRDFHRDYLIAQGSTCYISDYPTYSQFTGYYDASTNAAVKQDAVNRLTTYYQGLSAIDQRVLRFWLFRRLQSGDGLAKDLNAKLGNPVSPGADVKTMRSVPCADAASATYAAPPSIVKP